MKKSSEILSHIFNAPCYQKYNEISQVRHFIRLLSPSLKGGIAFGYIQNEILFLAFKHPAFKQEFYHKISLVKQLLKTYQNETSQLLKVRDIKCFVTYNAYHQERDKLQENQAIQCYGEIAHGDFINYAKDKKIYQIFENIREIILKNQEE